MASICKICDKKFDSDRSLHAHLKAHEIRMVEYYQTQYPRYDKHDENIIKFKNKDQYLSADFNSRTNMRMWLKNQPKDKAAEYCKGLLSKRKDKKNLIYSPCQVELRSVMIPPIHFYNKAIGDYYELCESIDLKNKYSYINNIVYGSEYDNPKHKIYIDTREQKPLKFKRETEVKTLKFGDYALSDKELTCNCYIERKSVGDFIGTMSGGLERFKNEIGRARDADAYLVILVEESLANCLSFNYLPHVYKKNTKATPEYIFRNVRDLIQEYPHIQFLFVHGRKKASEIIEKIFTCGCLYKKMDLQLAYDSKVL